MIPHPPPDELAAFLAGRLPPERSREIDAHLDDCEACRAAQPAREPPTLPELPLPPGYDLIEEIGRGGMGVVYRARRRADGREFAIKTLLPDYRRDPTFAGYLEREAEMTARVRHLRVLNGVQLRRYSDADPTPFIEFPWVPGTTLARMIGTPLARENPLRLVRWLIQCCQAVAAAHRQHPPIVHFDLKPDNLLVYDRDGEAVLIDFGLASEWPPPPGVTRTGMGTPAYMAPEVADPARAHQIGPRADVFALGGMLCAILTGHPPYDRADFGDTNGVKQAARDVILGPALRRLDAVRELPALVAFAKRCLSPDPADRPADAEEVGRELDRLSAPGRRRFPRLRSWAALLVVGVMAVCLLLVLLFRDPPPTQDELLTAGPWARFIRGRQWTKAQTDQLWAEHPRNPNPKKPADPFWDEGENNINWWDIGAYPLVKFHRPEWVEAVTLSHDVLLARPRPHNSDFTHLLPPLPAARISIPIPDTPGWATATTGDRLCKKPLTIAVAFTNGQYVDPLAAAGGGTAIATAQKRYGLGTELTGEMILTGLDKEARGGGSRAFVAVEGLRRQWEVATAVKLQVKLRNRPTVYEYDLHPRNLGWEKGIRDGEVD